MRPSPRASMPSLMADKAAHADQASQRTAVPTVEALKGAILGLSAAPRPPELADESANQMPASHDVLYPVAYNSSHASSPSSPGGGAAGNPPTSASVTLNGNEHRVQCDSTADGSNPRTLVSGALLKLSRPGCCGKGRWSRRFFIIKGRSLQYYRSNFASGNPRGCWDISSCTFHDLGTYQHQHNTFEVQVYGRSLMLSACKSTSVYEVRGVDGGGRETKVHVCPLICRTGRHTGRPPSLAAGAGGLLQAVDVPHGSASEP